MIEKASAKSAKPLDPEQLRKKARRAGATVAPSAVDRAARQLISELGKGSEPEPKLRRLLTAMLRDSSSAATSPADPSHAVAEWIAATPSERGKALVDLLLLADALPSYRHKSKQLRCPRLESRPT